MNAHIYSDTHLMIYVAVGLYLLHKTFLGNKLRTEAVFMSFSKAGPQSGRVRALVKLVDTTAFFFRSFSIF